MIALTTVKIATLAPMPRASVSTATARYPGRLASWREACLSSWSAFITIVGSHMTACPECFLDRACDVRHSLPGRTVRQCAAALQISNNHFTLKYIQFLCRSGYPLFAVTYDAQPR